MLVSGDLGVLYLLLLLGRCVPSMLRIDLMLLDTHNQLSVLTFIRKSMPDTVLYHSEGAIARITLNRPDKYNSLNLALTQELRAALDQASEDDNIRAVYLTGEGKAFCAGQDLQEVIQAGDDILESILRDRLNPIIERMRKLEKPIIGAINGVAAGAGANIALACDLTVAIETASFIQAFSKIGLIPDSGGTFFLPRLVGIQRATAYAMLGTPVPAPEAERMGMIYRALPAAEFASRSWQLAEQLAAMPTRALALIKQAFNASLENSLTEQLAVEQDLQIIAGHTYDYQEGVQAFVEKRKPVFRGK